ncbi:EME1, MMS4 [Phaffia rhodozyma]|uniref:EME1, MMS4 n=1 Tax=Phaffia rhodozyma TaxID=264483 RepID=A0A0F7SGA1_PHARH|nr:EME1, MMS4 [Phaffia rhodozyma]
MDETIVILTSDEAVAEDSSEGDVSFGLPSVDHQRIAWTSSSRPCPLPSITTTFDDSLVQVTSSSNPHALQEIPSSDSLTDLEVDPSDVIFVPRSTSSDTRNGTILARHTGLAVVAVVRNRPPIRTQPGHHSDSRPICHKRSDDEITEVVDLTSATATVDRDASRADKGQLLIETPPWPSSSTSSIRLASPAVDAQSDGGEFEPIISSTPPQADQAKVSASTSSSSLTSFSSSSSSSSLVSLTPDKLAGTSEPMSRLQHRPERSELVVRPKLAPSISLTSATQRHDSGHRELSVSISPPARKRIGLFLSENEDDEGEDSDRSAATTSRGSPIGALLNRSRRYGGKSRRINELEKGGRLEGGNNDEDEDELEMDVWEERVKTKARAQAQVREKVGKGPLSETKRRPPVRLTRGREKGLSKEREQRSEKEISDQIIGAAKPRGILKGKSEEEKAIAIEEKERAKALKQAEREAKKRELKVNKLRTDKTEAFRELLVELSAPSQNSSSSIHHLIPELEQAIIERHSSLSFFPFQRANVIRFRRRLRARYDELLKRFLPLEAEEIVPETTALIYLSTPELVSLVREDDLLDLPRELRKELGLGIKAQVMICVQGFNGWARKYRNRENREFAAMIRGRLEAPPDEMTGRRTGRAGRKTNRVGTATEVTDVTPEMIEKALVRLQIAESCFLMHSETDSQMLEGIISTVGDVAIRPYKLIEKTHLSFHPDKSFRRGSSFGDTYRKMLEQIPRVTPATSSAVVEEYPTLRTLMDAWDRLAQEGQDETEGQTLISELLIQNNKTGIPNKRKINQATSKRVYLAFRGDDELALLS